MAGGEALERSGSAGGRAAQSKHVPVALTSAAPPAHARTRDAAEAQESRRESSLGFPAASCEFFLSMLTSGTAANQAKQTK